MFLQIFKESQILKSNNNMQTDLLLYTVGTSISAFPLSALENSGY